VARRSPEFLTGNLCWFCGERINWGAIVRILRRDPGQADYEGRENTAHVACARAAFVPGVPLTFAGSWTTDSAAVSDARAGECGPCAICATAITPEERSDLVLQRPIGTIRKPAFAQEAVCVHRNCFVKKRHV